MSFTLGVSGSTSIGDSQAKRRTSTRLWIRFRPGLETPTDEALSVVELVVDQPVQPI
jgi:hypothetical protein